jgi:hypothetical protein
MNMPAIRRKPHVTVAYRPEDVPMLSWNKIRHLPYIDEVREERQINHLRTNILAPEKPPRPGQICTSSYP